MPYMYDAQFAPLLATRILVAKYTFLGSPETNYWWVWVCRGGGVWKGLGKGLGAGVWSVVAAGGWRRGGGERWCRQLG